MYNKKRANARVLAFLLSTTLAFSTSAGTSLALAGETDGRGSVDASLTPPSAAPEDERGMVSAHESGQAVIPSDQGTPSAPQIETPQPAQTTEVQPQTQAAMEEAPRESVPAATPVQPDAANQESAPTATAPAAESTASAEVKEAVSNDYEIFANGSLITSIAPSAPLAGIASSLGGTGLAVIDAATGLRYAVTESDTAQGVLSAIKQGSKIAVTNADADIARYQVSISEKQVSLTDLREEMCQVSFDANGGSINGSYAFTAAKGDAISRFAKTPEKAGYQFCGWFYGPEDTAARAYETDFIAQDTILYAHWTNGGTQNITYRFGYTLSGASKAVEFTEPYAVVSGTYNVIRFPAASVYGMVISAWVDSNSQPITGTMMTGSTTVDAVWEQNAAPAQPAVLPEQAPEQESTPQMQERSEEAANETAFLQADTTYSVSINTGDDAEPGSLTVDVTADGTYTLPDVKEVLSSEESLNWPVDDVPTREGYVFLGWKYSGGGDSLMEDFTDSSIEFSTDISLEAQWAPGIKVECGADENNLYINGTSTPAATTGAGLAETLAAVYETANGETIDLSGTSADYQTLDEGISGEDPKTMRNKLSDGDTADAGTCFSAASDQGVLILYTPTEEKARFSVSKQTGTDNTYFVAPIPEENYFLIQVSYNLNYDGAEAIDTFGFRTNEEALSYFDVEDPERDGYSFDGWYYDAACTLKADLADYNNDDITLYAGWIPEDSFPVAYNMNDAEFTDDHNDTVVTFSTAKYGTNAINGEAINAEDYAAESIDERAFKGWFTAPDGGEEVTGKDYDASITTVYAQWGDVLDLVFCDDDESDFEYIDAISAPDGNTLRSMYGDSYAMPKPIPREDYNFAGWYTAPTGGTKVTLDTVLSEDMASDGTITLYAHWSQTTYSVSFDPAGGAFANGSTDVLVKEVGEGDTLGTLPYVKKEGYRLVGWFDEDDNEVDRNTEPTSDATYTARWEEKEVGVQTLTLPAHSLEVESIEDLDTLFKDFTYTPSNAANARFIWTSSNPDVISVIDTQSKGKEEWSSSVTPFSLGSDGYADIVISTADGATSDSCTVTVKKKQPVTSIDIYRNSTQNVTASTIEVKYGEDLNLSRVFNPSNADSGTDGSWSSSNPSVIAAESSGFVYKGIGTTVLTFTNSEGVSASVTVVVKEDDKINEEHSVRTLAYVVPGTQTVHMGDPVNLNIIYTPMTDVHNATFVWTSDNPDVLSVSSDGRNVNYSYGGSTGTAHITVSTEDGTIHAVKTIVVVEKDAVDWTPDKKTYYTVSFETFGGSALPDETVEAFNSAILPTPTKDGYVFDGWYFDNSFTGEPVTSLVPTADTILYAHWVEDPNRPNIYTITFEPQNGNKATVVSYEEGSMLGAFPAVTYEGYHLIGWFTADEGGEEVTASTLVTEDKAYYAHWVNMEEEGRYLLTLDPNGGTLNGSSKASLMESDLVVGQAYWNDVSSYIPTMPGHKFTGYFDAKEGGTKVYNANGSCVKDTAYFDEEGKFKGSANLNVFAHWEETAEKFELNFDTRGGNKIAPVKYDVNTTVTDLPTPTREGWTFLGWFEHATAGTPITSVLIDKDKTIYAQWEKNPSTPVVKDHYTVTFDSQGGSAHDPVTVKPGESAELPEPTKDGYIFLGWFDAPTGGNHVTSMTPQDDVTLYAHWAKEKIVVKTFTITFDFQDGNKETITGSVYDDSTHDTLTNFPAAEKERADFLGWFTDKKDGVRVRSYGGDNDITLYAHFTEESSGGDTPPALEDYTLTFDSQGGTEVASITEKEGTSVKGFESPTREGYKFLGWYTASDGGNLVYSITLRNNVTLYAHWAAEAEKIYTIILDKQDGTTKTTYTMKVGETFTLPAAARTGYIFDGWYTSPSGGSRTTTYNGTEGSVTTFYAQWTKETAEPILVKKITLNKHELTITKGQGLGLSYTYSPKPASNASFVWTSSNPDVLAVITKVGDDGSTAQSLKVKSAGEVTLTISTTDGTVSDSCKITIKEAADSSTKNGTTDGNTDAGSTDAGSKSSASTPSGSGTTASSSSDSKADQKYVLTLVSTTGAAQKVTVKGTVTLDALATKLGYKVGTYKLKTAYNATETTLDKNTTIESLASTGSTGDMLIIAYDSAGKAMGSAKVAKTADGEFTVTLSKGTSATLNKYSTNGTSSGDSTTSLSGKSTTSATTGTSSGSGSASTATADGKGGAQVVANPSKTGDPIRYAVPIMTLLGGIFLTLAAFRKRKIR